MTADRQAAGAVALAVTVLKEDVVVTAKTADEVEAAVNVMMETALSHTVAAAAEEADKGCITTTPTSAAFSIIIAKALIIFVRSTKRWVHQIISSRTHA